MFTMKQQQGHQEWDDQRLSVTSPCLHLSGISRRMPSAMRIAVQNRHPPQNMLLPNAWVWGTGTTRPAATAREVWMTDVPDSSK